MTIVEAKMPAELEPIRRVKCTYKDCDMSFDTEKIMKNHKKHSDEHDYCHKCDEDFDSFEDYAMHKIVRPTEHGLACRVCGDEFKSASGLKRHIELNHKVDQKLTCFGCHKSFYRASLFIEHIEYGHCDVISLQVLQRHIIHKHLVAKLLEDSTALNRFRQKTSKFDAAVDYEEEGGVSLGDDPLGDDEEMDALEYKAIKPNASSDTLQTPAFVGQYPPLPTQSKFPNTTDYDVASTIGCLSLDDAGSDASTVIGSPATADPTSSLSRAGSAVHSRSSVYGGSAAQESTGISSTNRELKVWGNRKDKSTNAFLFPNAKAKSPPSEFSISAHDDAMEQEHGINIMRSHFWDPTSNDWNPEKFYDSVVCKYYCPFVCEQNFPIASDLNKHILNDHQIQRMKCPICLKYFNNATALISHCEAAGARCRINKTDSFNIWLNRMSGGFLSVEEKVRPDHLNTRKVLLRNEETGHMEMYNPLVASYLQYTVTVPADYKESVRPPLQIGGGPKPSPW